MLTGTDQPPRPQVPLGQWLQRWIDEDADPVADLDSLAGVMWHLRDAWARRRDSNIVLVHYADLLDDLEGAMRALARRLQIAVDEQHWPDLVSAATFDAMQAAAEQLAPDAAGVLRSARAFFRSGTSGGGAAVLTPDVMARYHARVAGLGTGDLLGWLHR